MLRLALTHKNLIHFSGQSGKLCVLALDIDARAIDKRARSFAHQHEVLQRSARGHSGRMAIPECHVDLAGVSAE